jgi:osmotically-inducible protein OsmY
MSFEFPPDAGTHPRKVENAAQLKLMNAGYRPLKSIHCRFDDGILTLRGDVPTYFHKQVAQEAIRTVESVRTIQNEIDVTY